MSSFIYSIDFHAKVTDLTNLKWHFRRCKWLRNTFAGCYADPIVLLIGDCCLCFSQPLIERGTEVISRLIDLRTLGNSCFCYGTACLMLVHHLLSGCVVPLASAVGLFKMCSSRVLEPVKLYLERASSEVAVAYWLSGCLIEMILTLCLHHHFSLGRCR